jgi:hypothetical protein
MKFDAASTTQFKFLDAKLYVKRVRVHPSSCWHIMRLEQGFTGPLQPDDRRNQVIHLLKGLPVSSWRCAETSCLHHVKNTDNLGSMNSNSYNFRHFDKLFLAVC